MRTWSSGGHDRAHSLKRHENKGECHLGAYLRHAGLKWMKLSGD